MKGKAAEPRDDLVEDVMRMFDETLGREEYRHLGLDQEVIRTRFQQRVDGISEELRPALATREEEEARAARMPRSVPHALMPHLVKSLVTIGIGLGVVEVMPATPLRTTSFVPALVIYSFIVWYAPARESIARAFEAKEITRAARKTYREEVDRVVSEAVRLTINELYEETGAIRLPKVGPSLVELNTAKLVPSHPRRYVEEFLASHRTSAVGVAGPRGSGKSSLLRAVCDSPDRQISVLVSAPVHYERLDFTRRLVLSATKKLLEAAGADPARYEATAARRGSMMRTAAAFFLLGAVTATSALQFVDGTLSPAESVTIVLLSGLALVLGSRTRPKAIVGRNAPPYVRRAADLYEAIEWEHERTDTARASLSLGAARLGAERASATTRRRRARSHPDLVADFSEVLTMYSKEQADERLVIAIDELDKLSERDDLVEAVNGVKDLFHIPGVHFLVAVSTDALASFEQRGLPARDAFDSAFDTVIRVGRLTPDESVEVVLKRAIGFPRALAIFCHAWSGGLPRDLLRSARACVERQRSATAPLAAAEIVRQVVTADLEEAIHSRLESLPSDDTSDDVALPLLHLTEVVSRVRRKELGERDALSQLDGLDPSGIEHVLALSKVGLCTLFFFTAAGVWDPAKEEPSDVRDVANDIAAAVAAMALPGPARDKSVIHALQETGLVRTNAPVAGDPRRRKGAPATRAR